MLVYAALPLNVITNGVFNRTNIADLFTLTAVKQTAGTHVTSATNTNICNSSRIAQASVMVKSATDRYFSLLQLQSSFLHSTNALLLTERCLCCLTVSVNLCMNVPRVYLTYSKKLITNLKYKSRCDSGGRGADMH
jgi:hypothetical protein